MLKNLWNVVLTSGAFKLNVNDLKALLRNSAIAGAVASVLYFSTNVSVLDMGSYTPVILTAVYAGCDALVKFLKNNATDPKLK